MIRPQNNQTYSFYWLNVLTLRHESPRENRGDSTQAIDLLIPQKSVTKKYNLLELVRFGHHRSSDYFNNIEELSEKRIQKNQDVSDVWNTYFRDLSSISKNITIVDRYAIENFLDKPKMNGLERVIQELSSSNNNINLKIISSLSHKPNEHKSIISQTEFRLNKIAESVPETAIATIKLYLVEDYLMKQTHGRWIRFENIVCNLDTGVEVLEGTSVNRSVEWGLKTLQNDIMDDENNLICKCKRSIEITLAVPSRKSSI